MPLEILNDKQRLQSLKEMLHQYSAPADEALIEHLEGGAVKCYACGHRCLVKPGRDGVCRVRFNDNGTLLVPFGYVGALACDPIEKKPFFHVLPGSDALTFGMLGCDYHCGYCFTPDTVVITDRGPTSFESLFASVDRKFQQPDGEIALPANVRTLAQSGTWRRVEGVFRHRYRGRLALVRPFYLPELRCTEDHRVYATDDVSRSPQPIHARELTLRHYLAVPKRFDFSQPQIVHVAEQLRPFPAVHRGRWRFSAESRQQILDATQAGQTSAQIGLALGKSASYVRHVRSKLVRRDAAEPYVCRAALDPDGAVRFAYEHRPGIPASVPLDDRFARLLGLYCAEGSVVRSRSRPNSHVLNFSFGHGEAALAGEVVELLRACLRVEARLVYRSTTRAVAASKASAALLLKSLCGSRATAKRVPAQLFDAPRPVMQSYVDAYVEGDGHRYRNGKVSLTTVSREMAYGIAALALKLGHLPSIYDTPMSPRGRVLGRTVNRAPHQYTVVWYETDQVQRRIVVTDDYYLVPLRGIEFIDYDGDVYNMQVEVEHNYLANFLLVSNCQNWVTSQMLRDVDAVAPPKFTTPEQLVDIAIQQRAPVVASSYNEPLITSEWAVAVFKEARSRGLKCAYISNGNGTPQVLDYIRPHVEAYKVDLKTFNPRHYRELGGVMDNVTDTIRMLKERNFWVEIVTLVVPGFSDDPDDLKRMADFLAAVDPLMPWHMTAFHPDYKMTEGYRSTTADDLMRIVEYGKQAGLKYMYPGNLPGQVGEWENTRCHHCNATLIERLGFRVQRSRIRDDGLCPDCHKPIPGIWGQASGHGDGRVRPLL